MHLLVDEIIDDAAEIRLEKAEYANGQEVPVKFVVRSVCH